MDSYSGFDAKNLELLAKFDDKMEPPEFLTKILGCRKPYKELSVYDRIQLN
jgi:hypothetical protein